MQTQKRFFYELYLILAIALPMMIAQVAQVGTGFVDTIMAGAVGKSDLAAVGFGSSVFATIYITLLAFPTALNPLDIIFSFHINLQSLRNIPKTKASLPSG